MGSAFILAAAEGAIYFWLLMIWLASAIACQELSRRKGYGEKVGLGTGLILSALGVVIWIVLYFALPTKHERRA